MTNLIPEVRVNKNGVPVTKHVRASTTTRDKSSLPAPSAPSGPMLIDALLQGSRTETASILRSELGKKKYRLSDKLLNKMFETLHEDMLDTVEGFIIASPFAAEYDVKNLAARCASQRSFADLNNVVVVADFIKENNLHRDYSTYVSGLQMLRDEGAPVVDWSKEDKSEWSKPQAVLKAVTALDNRYVMRADINGLTAFLKSPRLFNLILKRPQDIDRIINLLEDRQLPVHTEDQIEDLVNLLDQKPANAIAEGVL